MNQMYGFEGEVKAKYTAQMFQLFSEVFQWLPLAQCINNKVLVSSESIFMSPTPFFFICFLLLLQHFKKQWLNVLFFYSPCQVMHGGLFSEDGVTLEDLRKIDRNRQPPDSGSLLFRCCGVSVATNDQEKMGISHRIFCP